MDGKSLDILSDKLRKLKKLVPEAFTEDKIDWEKLKLTLGDDLNLSEERYHLNWAGKSEIFRVLQQRAAATLIPNKKESVNFDETENVFIEGENLEVLKVIQKSYFGKIKMIYIDPPYNTGNDSFIYPDKFSETKAEYLKRIGDKDEEGYLLKEGMFRKNSKDAGHYHSNWLSMMYPRLYLARNLLRDDGVIFISIDDNEVHNLRLIMNEIFGEENFVTQFIIINNLKGRNDKKNVALTHEYLLVFQKNDFNSYGIPFTDEQRNEFKYVDEKGFKYALRDLRKRGRPDRREDRPNMFFPIFYNPNTQKCSLEKKSKNDIEITPKRGDGTDGRWRWGYNRVKENLNILHPKKSTSKKRWDIDHRVYMNLINNKDEEEDYYEKDEVEPIDEKTSKPKSFWIGGEISTDVGRRNIKNILLEVEFDYPKAVEFLKKVIFYATKGDDIILDFFAGSGTTAQAVLELNKEDGGNRKFILVQLPEKTKEDSEAYKAGYKTIADICKERVRRVIKKLETEDEKSETKKKNQTELELNENGHSELVSESPEKLKQVQLETMGFKVFKLSPSNFKIWRSDIVETEEDLNKMVDIFDTQVKDGSKEENMLYELMLKSGYALTDKVEKKKGYYSISNSELVIVLNKIKQKQIDEILSIKPKNCIMLDKLFAGNDQLKTNTSLQFKDAEIEFTTV